MNRPYVIKLPFRVPNWRHLRVVELLRHRRRPLPLRLSDGPYVRHYLRLLSELTAAGADSVRQNKVFRDNPDVFSAHQLFYSPDVETRQILEVRLLSRESFEAIAPRFGTEPKTIEYYEALFFDVRDRRTHSDWIQKVIQGSFAPGRSATPQDSQEMQGYVLRWFGYHGGPLSLDAAIHGISDIEPPKNRADVPAWCEQVRDQLVQTKSTAALATNVRTAIPLTKLAMKPGGTGPDRDSEGHTNFEQLVASELESVDWRRAGETYSDLTPYEEFFAQSAVEPRTHEMHALANGQMPASLARAIELHDGVCLNESANSASAAAEAGSSTDEVGQAEAS